MEKRIFDKERRLLNAIEFQKNNLDIKALEAELKETKNKLRLKESVINKINENTDDLRKDFNRVSMEVMKLKCEAMLNDKELMKDVNNTRSLFEKAIKVFRKDGLKRVIYKILKKLKLRK